MERKRYWFIWNCSFLQFQNTKNLTCGEGGAITTNSDELYYNIMNMLNMGKDKDGKYSF